MGSGFTSRFTDYPSQAQLTQIEGVAIIDLAPQGAVTGVGTGVVACVGEFADMTSAVAVDGAGNVTTAPVPVEVFSAQDRINKVGGWDATLGQFGGANGNGHAAVVGKQFARLVCVPVNLCSAKAARSTRQLPTCKSATDPTPIVPVSGLLVPAGTEFKTGAGKRVRTGARLSFADSIAYASGVDGAVTSVSAAATAGTETAAAGNVKILVGDTTEISIDGAVAPGQIWTWGGTAAVCLMGAATYGGGQAGSFTIQYQDETGLHSVQITIGSTAIGELALLAQINDLLAAANVPAYVEDNATKLPFKSSRLGSSTKVAITLISGGAAFTTDTGIATTLSTPGTATITKTAGTGTKTITIAFLDAAQPFEIQAALNAPQDPVVGGTLTLTIPGTQLVMTSSTTGAASSVQVLAGGTNSIGFDTAIHSGSAAGAGTATTNIVASAGSDFTALAAQKGDALVIGVIGQADPIGTGAATYRVKSVDSTTQLTVERQDGAAWSFGTSAAMPWALYPALTADTGGNEALSDAAGYTVPSRPLDIAVAAATIIAPAAPTADGTAAAWLPGSGLKLVTDPVTGLAYSANVQAPNPATNGDLENLYAKALDALLADAPPARDVNIVFAARASTNIAGLLEAHADLASQQGLGRIAIVSPPVNQADFATTVGATGVGATRDERVIYSWPPYLGRIPDAVGVVISTADGRKTDDGMLDLQADAVVASVLSVLAPNRNPGEATATTKVPLSVVKGFARGITAMNRSQYIVLKASGVCALRLDGDVGPVFQSGVTSSVTSGETKISRRRMADYIEDSAARRLAQLVKLPMSDGLKGDITGELIDFLEGMESPTNKAAQMIDDYAIDAVSGNTADGEAAGIFMVIGQVLTTPTADVLGLQFQIGDGTVIVTAT